nr:hypothetical protein CFP56_23121 [Quercus suber]
MIRGRKLRSRRGLQQLSTHKTKGRRHVRRDQRIQRLNEKLNGEYEGGDKQKSPLLRDNGLVDERGGEAETQVTSSPHKGGKRARVQTVRAASMEPLEIVVGGKKKLDSEYGRKGE